MSILVTGGAGYIGSHACLSLLEAGYEVVVLDNYSNSSEESLKRVESLSGKKLTVIQGSLCDQPLLNKLFESHKICAVIHFAGLKAVGESVEKPLLYYENNVEGSLKLIAAMKAADVKTIIFSSSATVYGDPDSVPIVESARIQPTNPYGHTKAMVETIFQDVANEKGWKVALLRYFNPVGAHPSGRIGEDPNDIPNNLLPYISRVAVGQLEQLSVFGDDYDTPDGTGVRDYIHVMDLVDGHTAALKWLETNDQGSVCEAINLGTGKGYSVLEMVKAFEQASQQPVPYKVVGRRAGDIATCYADASKAKKLLGWSATRGLQEMMKDTWAWQSSNPNGYKD